MGRSRRIGRLALAVAALLLAACNSLTVDQSAVYTSSPTQEITGTVKAVGDQVESVTVNGIDADVEGESWRVDLPLDGDAVFNPVVVEAHYELGQVLTERRTVVYGDGETAFVMPEGAVLDDAVGLRLNDSSFTKIGPVVKGLTTIDPGAIAPVGTVVMDECQTTVFGVCTLYVKAFVSVPPTIADFDVAFDSHTDAVQAIVGLAEFGLTLHIDARVVGVPVGCDLRITADGIDIDGNYALSPDGADPRLLDVNLVGATPAVTLHGFDDDFVSGVCSVPGIEQLVGLFMGDVESMMRNNLTTMLGDPDGAGPVDSPVAEATEGALANVHVAGPIGDALGLSLTSTIQQANEDEAGLGLRATANFSSVSVVPGAPDLTGTVGWGDVLGALGSTTPSGQPFDVAVGASATGFNQLLAAETERGLLNVDVAQLDGQPLTLKSLLDLIGAGGLVTEDVPLVIELRPEIAPVVTTGPGPDGALAEMQLSGYRVTVRVAGAPDSVLVGLVIDFTTGVGMTYTDGELKFTFDAPAEEDFSATIVQNPLGLPDSIITDTLRELTPRVFTAIQDTLPGFPLPGFVGLQLQPVEIGRSGPGLVLYADLAPA